MEFDLHLERPHLLSIKKTFDDCTSWFDNGSFNIRVFGPDNFPCSIHRNSRFLSPHFNNNNSLIKSHSNFLSSSQVRTTPSSFKSVIQSLFQSIRISMPNLDSPIFTTTNNNRLSRMKTSK